MKSLLSHDFLLDFLSLPVWEEWIEMPVDGVDRGADHVSSRMGRVD